MNSLANRYNKIRVIFLRDEIDFLEKEYLTKEHEEDITEKSDLLVALQKREEDICRRIVD